MTAKTAAQKPAAADLVANPRRTRSPEPPA